MNISRLMRLILITIVLIQCISCSSAKESQLQPDENINSRYLSVRHLEFSSDKIDFVSQSLGVKTVKSFSVSNHEKNYPIKFSIESTPNNITLLDTSTCPKDNATVYPGEDCVYSILLSNNEESERLDNIIFYDNYSEVYLEVSSKTATQGVALPSNDPQGVRVANFPLIVNKEYHSFGRVDSLSKNISTDFIISNSSSSEVNFDISSLTSGGYIIHPISTCVVGSNKLGAGENCLMNIVFSPTSRAIYNDSFQVSYGGEKISVSLTGVGAKKYADINSLILVNDFIDYGTVINGEYRVDSVTVRNNSNNSFMKFSLSDISDGFAYLPSSTCGVYYTTLPPSQSCTIFVRYLSADGGGFKVWVGNHYKEIKLLSNSLEEKVLSIEQSVVDFDNILVNSVNSNIFILNNLSEEEQSINITSSDGITVADSGISIPAESSKVIDFTLQPQNVDRDFQSNIKINTNDGLGYVLPVKAEVVEDSNIDITQFLSSASIGERVYIYDDNMLIYNPLIDNKSNRLYSYSLSSLIWKKIEYLGDIPENDIGTELLFFNDAYYLFGGENKEGNLSNNLFYFDTVNEKWYDIIIDDGDIKPTARKGYKGVVAQDRLYIMGGVDSSGSYINDIWAYDFNKSSNGWSKVNIEPSFTAEDINNSTTILFSDNDSLYIIVANNVYSYKISGELKWEEEYDISDIENIDIIIKNKVLYLVGSKIGYDKLFLSKLDMSTGEAYEIETDVTINNSVKPIIHLNKDGLIYLFLMFDDRVRSKLYYLNDISSSFVEIDTRIYPYIDMIDASTLYKEYIYYLSSDSKLYSYNLNTRQFEYKKMMSCATISDTVTPHLISDSSNGKLYVVDGSNSLCEYDISLDEWQESSVAFPTGIKDNFSVAIYDNHLWVYGGIKSDNIVSDELWKYSINESSNWVKVQKSSSYSISDNRVSNYGVYDHKMVVYKDGLYIVGGYLDLLKSKNNSIFKIELSETEVSVTTVSALDMAKQLSDNFGVTLYKKGFVLLGLNDDKTNVLYYDVVNDEFLGYSNISGDYFDKEYVSTVISFGSSLYLHNNIYSRVSKIILE